MVENIFFGLQFSALVILHLLGILMIVCMLVITLGVMAIKSKIQELIDTLQEKSIQTLDSVRDAAEEVADAGFNVASFAGIFSPLFFKKKEEKKASLLNIIIERFMRR